MDNPIVTQNESDPVYQIAQSILLYPAVQV